MINNNVNIFIRFLNENHILKKYLINVFQQRNTMLYKPNNLECLINDLDLYILEYINESFTWDETKEGFYFWCDKERQLSLFNRIYKLINKDVI